MSSAGETKSSRDGALPALAISAVIAKTELRRAARKIRDQDVWLALLAVGVLGFVVVSPLAFDAARDVGASLAAGDDGALTHAPLAAAATWVFLAAFMVVSGVGSYGEVDNADGMLTIRPPKDVAGGLFLSSLAQYIPWIAYPVAVVYAGLSVGAGTPLPFAGGVAAGAVVLLSSCAVGYPVGLFLKGVFRRSETLSRLKPVLGVAAGAIYFWLMFSGEFVTVAQTIEPAVLASPLGWLDDLALLTTPGASASSLAAVGAVSLAAVLFPVGVLATVRAARYAWYVDRAEDNGTQATEPEDAGTAPAGRLGRLLSTVCRRQGTAGVAAVTLVRAYRAPMQSLFVAVPLLFAFPLFEQLLTSGSLPWYAPWLVVFYGAWAAGAASPLNVLGNQGATLPTLLTARSDGRTAVRGTVLAAVLLVAPLTTLGAAWTATAAGVPRAEAVAVTVAAPVGVVAGSVLAAGFGALFPRFESIDVTASRSAVLPSKAAFGLFSLLLTVGQVGAVFTASLTARRIGSVLLSERLPFGLTPSASTLESVGWFLVVLVLAAVPVAYLVAARRIDTYRL